MIRILVVDDQQLVRMGLRMLFEQAQDIEILGEADNGAEAVRLAEHLTPDVVLMDLRMPGMDGITATRRILTARPATRVVALTTFDDDDHLYPVLAAGACGFLVKDTPPAELLEAVRRAANGEAPSAVTSWTASSPRPSTPVPPRTLLRTSRQPSPSPRASERCSDCSA